MNTVLEVIITGTTSTEFKILVLQKIFWKLVISVIVRKYFT
jgi:hypothetical protein